MKQPEMTHRQIEKVLAFLGSRMREHCMIRQKTVALETPPFVDADATVRA